MDPVKTLVIIEVVVMAVSLAYPMGMGGMAGMEMGAGVQAGNMGMGIQGGAAMGAGMNGMGTMGMNGMGTMGMNGMGTMGMNGMGTMGMNGMGTMGVNGMGMYNPGMMMNGFKDEDKDEKKPQDLALVPEKEKIKKDAPLRRK